MIDCRFARTARGIALSGELVLSTATGAFRDGERLLRSDAVAEIDVSRVSSIDSCGLAVIMALMGRARTVGAIPRVVGLSPAGKSLARVGGVLDLLQPERDGEDSAIPS